MARDGDNRLPRRDAVRRADRFHRGRRTDVVHRREPDCLSRRHSCGSRAISIARQMAGAFQLLRSNDLIWSRLVHDYLMGERRADDRPHGLERRRDPHAAIACIPNICAGCSSTTISPKAATSPDGRPVALADIHIADLCCRHRTDHVAPWRSTYKINLPADAEVTYRAHDRRATMPVSSPNPATKAAAIESLPRQSISHISIRMAFLNGQRRKMARGGRSGAIGWVKIPARRSRHRQWARRN